METCGSCGKTRLLDSRGLNGHLRMFSDVLPDVEYRVIVMDIKAGLSETQV